MAPWKRKRPYHWQGISLKQAEQNLQEAKEFLDERGVECETHQLARGLSPGEDLVRFAEDNQIDQIYVGIVVILKAPCPVITAK
jgi:nucleotide-binding universal stress UspA family protein